MASYISSEHQMASCMSSDHQMTSSSSDHQMTSSSSDYQMASCYMSGDYHLFVQTIYFYIGKGKR